jgi:hypothetical protein
MSVRTFPDRIVTVSLVPVRSGDRDEVAIRGHARAGEAEVAGDRVEARAESLMHLDAEGMSALASRLDLEELCDGSRRDGDERHAGQELDQREPGLTP